MDELRSKLCYEPKNGYDRISLDERLALEEYCGEYMEFLNFSRTEREAVENIVAMAEERGFVPYTVGMALKPGMRIYRNNRGKTVMLAVIGSKPLSEGIVIAGSHIDSPRLDLKPHSIYETDEFCYLKTHYYGGVKKYQWITIPLELHGVVALKNGEVVKVCIGREPEDPKFVITDLLPHLAKDQLQKTLAEGFTGEGLNILVGSTPYAGEGKDRVKLAILSLLNDEYGITEEDFLSAELTAVPAFDVCEVGLDRSMIGGYGHDDKVCAYAVLKALFDLKEPERTCVCVLVDKEEIGSEGVSGIRSQAFDCFVEDLCAGEGVRLNHCYQNSLCFSSDVSDAYDPLYAEAFDKRNESRLNYGVAIMKYTGSRGKYNSSDASAELVARLRRTLDGANVVWQLAELGKVDQGGGGTIARFMAVRNIDTIDAGVPVLSMHAPFEVVGKLDCYMTYRAALAIYQAD